MNQIATKELQRQLKSAVELEASFNSVYVCN